MTRFASLDLNVRIGFSALETVAPSPPYRLDGEKLATLAPILTADLQSNILRPNNKLRTDFLFLRFSSDLSAVRGMLADLLDGLSVKGAGFATFLQVSRLEAEGQSCGSGYDNRRPLLNVLITAHGYAALGFNPSDFFPREFCIGPRHPETLRKLGDPAVGDWQPSYYEHWDALIVLSHDDPDVLTPSLGALVEYLQSRGVIDSGGRSPATHVEHGNMLDRQGRPSRDTGENFEIFGFRDGISQPVFLEDDWKRHKEFQYDGRDPLPSADPRLPLSCVLARDPFGTALREEDDGTKHFGLGSFFVFRKLEQDFSGFDVRKEHYVADVRHRRDFLRALYAAKQESTPGNSHVEKNPYSEEATRDEEAFVLSSLIGRMQDGQPALCEPGKSLPEQFNNFDYSSDPDGVVCPFSAHIRKANPRGATGDLDRERARRIARRGMPYGTREAPQGGRLTGEAGLLFFCAQANIADQFEYIQSVWLNGHNDPTALPTPAIDSLVGQVGEKGPKEQRHRAYASAFGRREGHALVAQNEEQRDRAARHGWINQTVRMDFDFQDYVELKGAEYLFAPSISGLRCLSSE